MFGTRIERKIKITLANIRKKRYRNLMKYKLQSEIIKKMHLFLKN